MRYCVQKKEDGKFVAWDGRALVENPINAGRFSPTICERKYAGYKKIPFPEAYNQYHTNMKGKDKEPALGWH
ncbi:hypothetical protein FACS1894109_10950 [Spirochaetia bacterium]|nr:hypothetical protein FACS1894109_10950 [Spirochaetia bacterium]